MASNEVRLVLADRVAIRRLSSEDVDDITEIHRAAFPDAALTRLGVEAVRRYYAWQFQAPHKDLCALGADVDGQVTGYIIGGVIPTAITGYLQRNKGYLAWLVLTHPWLVGSPLFRERLARGLRTLIRFRKETPVPANSEHAKKHFDLLVNAVHPRHQGLGIGKALMSAAEAAAVGSGYDTLTTFVYPDNEKVWRTWERIGYEKRLVNGRWRGNMMKHLS